MNLKKLLKFFAVTVSSGAALWGCAQTPNSVSMTVNQGQCVTGPYPGYESQASSNGLSGAFPINANLPATSPYCAAITITNNNSGQNANNIQAYQSGIVVSLPSLTINGTATTYLSTMIDYSAAGIGASYFGGTNQSLYNVNFFDPNNCGTTQGAKVNTLSTNGGSCTFYLQLNGESLPVGVYPIGVTYNYTNGNNNYSTAVTLNQRVNLYVGSDTASQQVAISNAASTSPTANSVISANSPETQTVFALARDAFGNVYSGDLAGGIYRYSGTSISAWSAISGLPNGLAVMAMTTDSSGNLYSVNSAGKVFMVSAGSLSATQIGSVPVALNVQPQAIQIGPSQPALSPYLLVTAGNTIYQCEIANTTAQTPCVVSQSYSPASFVTSPIVQMLNTNNIFIAYGESVAAYGKTAWQIYTGLPGASVNALVNYANTLYAGVAAPANESGVYIATGTNFVPFASSSNNYLAGNVLQLATDPAQGIFVAGSGLTSQDFSGSNNLAYVGSSIFGIFASWIPISGLSGNVYALQTASQFTPY